MEHLIITDYRDDYKRIKPEAGYRILDIRGGQTHSVVVCKERYVKYFKAIEI